MEGGDIALGRVIGYAKALVRVLGRLLISSKEKSRSWGI